MSLDFRVKDFFSPNYTDINNAEQFWNRTNQYILNSNKEIADIVKTDPSARARLEELTKKNFDAFGLKYFTERDRIIPTLARYGGAVVGGIGAGSVVAGLGGILAGAGIAGVSVISAGLLPLTAGILAFAGADLYDMIRTSVYTNGMQRVTQPVAQEKEWQWYDYINPLNYVKKGVNAVWETVKSAGQWVFSRNNPNVTKATIEGVVTNALAGFGYDLFGSELAYATLGAAAPYAQIGSLATLAVSFYRGGKKFDDVIIEYIKNKTQQEFLQERKSSQTVAVRPLEKALKEDYGKYHMYTNEKMYDVMHSTPEKFQTPMYVQKEGLEWVQKPQPIGTGAPSVSQGG